MAGTEVKKMRETRARREKKGQDLVERPQWGERTARKQKVDSSGKSGWRWTPLGTRGPCGLTVEPQAEECSPRGVVNTEAGQRRPYSFKGLPLAFDPSVTGVSLALGEGMHLVPCVSFLGRL